MSSVWFCPTKINLTSGMTLHPVTFTTVSIPLWQTITLHPKRPYTLHAGFTEVVLETIFGGKFEIAFLLGLSRASLLILLVWVCSSAISFPAIAWWRATATGPSPPYKVSSESTLTLLDIQCSCSGWPTGNGKKLSNSQACCLAQLFLATA